MHKSLQLTLALAVALPITLLAGQSPVAALDQNATVSITDSGFDPDSVTVLRGGTVFWTNNGTHVHTATGLLGPVAFDTGGISKGQTFSINFPMAGGYKYKSAVDCGNAGGNPTAGFDCGYATVIVIDPSISSGNVGSLATPTPAPTPTDVPAGPPQSVSVSISGTGFTPATTTVALGGSVTFINNDPAAPHTATTTGGGNPRPFDTGGLAPYYSGSFSFAIPGTYTYTSAIDCHNGASGGSFGCGPYTIIVSSQPSALAPSVPASAIATVAPGASAVVGIDDTNGFTPAALAVQAGQLVTWVNNGSQIHSVVSNPGYASQFDSGGLAPGQKFTFTFPGVGNYGYHSSTEPKYGQDAFGRTVVTQYQFNGTIVAQ